LLPVSDPARQALALAQDEARALDHSYVGTEHILLGLLREKDGIAATALVSLAVTYDRVLAAVVRLLGGGVEPANGELPMTGPADAVVERAGREAAGLGAERVGTDHILVALIFEPRGAAARILLGLDADAAAIRSAVAAARAG
jgi:ATP-dependent Clp protease ATP-binding subunit ClpC